MADDEGPSEAAQAFQELRAEVTLMRRAVERLTAERMEVPEPPDYSETLGVIANNITATAQRVDMLVKSPMLAMTPEQLAGRITAAASTARQEDRQTIATARTGLEDVTRQLHGYVVSARRSDEQNRWLMWSAIGGIVVGMILWRCSPALSRAPCPRAGNGRRRWRHARSTCRCGKAASASCGQARPMLSPVSRQAIGSSPLTSGR